MTYNFKSPSKFKEEIRQQLSTKAKEVINNMSDKMSEKLVSEETEAYFFSAEDWKTALKIANDVGIILKVNEAELEIEIAEENDVDDVDEFFVRLEEAGLYFDEDDDEEYDMSEKSLLKKIRPEDKRNAKKLYRKNKAKLKLKGKKFRKSAKGKKLSRKAKKMAKRGKTSTGKRITRKK